MTMNFSRVCTGKSVGQIHVLWPQLASSYLSVRQLVCKKSTPAGRIFMQRNIIADHDDDDDDDDDNNNNSV